MRSWNLSSFDDVVDTVVTRGESTVVKPKAKRIVREKFRRVPVATVAVAVAVMSLVPLQVRTSANDSRLIIPYVEKAGIWNVVRERPPLDLLFGGKIDGKWSKGTEQEMLRKAVAISSYPGENDLLNLIKTSLVEVPQAALPLSDDAILNLVKKKSELS